MALHRGQLHLTRVIFFLFSWMLQPVSWTPMMPLSWKLPLLLTFGLAKEPVMLRNQEHKSCWRHWEQLAQCRLLRVESQVREAQRSLRLFLCSCMFPVIISRMIFLPEQGNIDIDTEGLLESIFIMSNSTLMFVGFTKPTLVPYNSAASPTQTVLILGFPWAAEASVSLSLFQIISGQLWVEKLLTVPPPGWRTRRWMLTLLVFLHAPTRADASLWVFKSINSTLVWQGWEKLSPSLLGASHQVVTPQLPWQHCLQRGSMSRQQLRCQQSNLLKHQSGPPLVNN